MGFIEDTLSGEPKPTGALITHLPTVPKVIRLRKLGCPIVRLGRLEHPEDTAVPVVLPDFTQAGRMAVDHFAERGFHDLAMFGHRAMDIVPLIETGLVEQAHARGCRCEQYLIKTIEGNRIDGEAAPSCSRLQSRNAKFIDWLSALPKPVGLLACSDHYANIASMMCKRLGLSVPEDVALLSVGNHRSTCEMMSEPISAIDLGRTEAMRVAIDLLERLIEGKTVPTRTYISPPRIETRRSTDILAVEHPLVARAIRYIWDRLDHDISVDDVAAALRTPRYKLERLFRKHYSRGMHAELRRVRLERFAQLLRTTNKPVSELAPLVGFKSPNFLHGSFCKEYGTTPRQYRIKSRQTASHPLTIS